MGYTHYYTTKNRELNEDKFILFTAQVRKIANVATHQGIFMQRDYDDDRGMIIGSHKVWFNGRGDEGHETFVLTTHCNEFCKTARKPYDTMVTATLIAFKLMFGDRVAVRSDGDNSDWKAGKELFEKAIGTEPKVKILRQDESNVLIVEAK